MCNYFTDVLLLLLLLLLLLYFIIVIIIIIITWRSEQSSGPLVSGNGSEWDLLLSLFSLVLIVTVTCRNTPGLTELTPTDRPSSCPAPGHRPPAPPLASLLLIKPNQSILGSIDSDVRRGGSEPARGLRRDQRHRSSEWWHQRVRVPILRAWADRSFIRLIDLLIAAPIRVSSWLISWLVWSADRFQTETWSCSSIL